LQCGLSYELEPLRQRATRILSVHYSCHFLYSYLLSDTSPEKEGDAKSKGAPVGDGAAQRHFVGVLEVPPDRQPVGDAGGFSSYIAKKFG
jgi:hypothetical protein